MYLKKTLTCLLAVSSFVALAREADSLRARVAQHVKTLSVGAGACPGSIVLTGGEAVPLAFGRVNGVKAPVAAATAWGRGRAVAITHEAFFSPEMAKRRENVVFLRECLSWLAGRQPTTIYLDRRLEMMRPAILQAFKNVSGFKLESVGARDGFASLPADAVLVTSIDSQGRAQADVLRAFVEKGGRVLSPVVGWGWQQVSGGKSFRTESPFNAVMGPAGIYASGVIVDREQNGFYSVTPDLDLPGMTADDSFELAASGQPLPNALGARCLYTLGGLTEVLPLNEAHYLPRLKELAAKGLNNFLPSPEHPLGPTRVQARLGYQLFQNEWLAQPARVWSAHPAAKVYPGVPEKGSRRETREIAVDLSVPRWQSTGLFAVAGEPLTVTLPEGCEKLGLRVRVGSTTCRVTSHTRWNRAPIVDVELPLTQTTTQFSSPFGGLVYLVVPNNAKGKVQVKVGPACPAAWYVEGRDTPETWLNALRTSPAPFVEIENDHVAISVPFKYVQNLRDPAPLLQVWREIIDNDARLTGLPTNRVSPERIVADVQLCAGYMHAGYPIMVPTSCLRNLMNERVIRAGNEDDVWGFFHEMGHNHQNYDWTFNGTGEVTVNFFTLYNMLKICGKTAYQTKMGDERLAQRVKDWNLSGRPMDVWCQDPFLALDFFAKLIEKYGWEAFEKLFAEYRTLSPAERPKNDLDKRIQFCRRLSRIVGEDLSAEFKFLGVPPVPKTETSKK